MPYELEHFFRHAINYIQQPRECLLLALSGLFSPPNGMSAFKGQADSLSCRRTCPLMTQSGHSCLGAIRKRSLPVIGSRGYLLPALRTATPQCCAVGGPAPQRHRRVRGRTRTKSGSRMTLQVLGCDADVSLRPAGIPYQFQCAEIAPRRWLGVHLAQSPTKLLSSGSE